jgi:hypothetical protein
MLEKMHQENNEPLKPSRRAFLKKVGAIAGAASMAGLGATPNSAKAADEVTTETDLMGNVIKTEKRKGVTTETMPLMGLVQKKERREIGKVFYFTTVLASESAIDNETVFGGKEFENVKEGLESGFTLAEAELAKQGVLSHSKIFQSMYFIIKDLVKNIHHTKVKQLLELKLQFSASMGPYLEIIVFHTFFFPQLLRKLE